MNLLEERRPAMSINNSVFLVFGRKADLRNSIELKLKKWGVNCITISDNGNIGDTTIESLEKLSGKARFAVVLFSGDDEGRLYEPNVLEKDKQKLAIRARENVVAELGYFMAKYGRENVCTLYEHGVTIPSDFSGVTYISLESNWELKLLQYLQKKGFNIKL